MPNLYRAISNLYANAAKGYAERFPSIGEGDYKPAYACVESKTKLEIKAEPYANITFKNERDVPLALDDEGNPTSDIIGGYMPVGRHYGFIYNNPKTAYIAHELGHGVLTLHHTFADETETFNAPQETTDNLMDYNGGILLNHKQWQWAHGNHGREWFEEEEEGEIFISDICIKPIPSSDEVSKFLSTAYNTVTNQIVALYDEVTEYSVAATDELAIASLIKTAEYIEPNVSKYNEAEKQQAFENDANKTVAILLYEFATGEGEDVRTFTSLKENSFARRFLEGRILREIQEDFYNDVRKYKLTYKDFQDNGIRVALEFSPDQTSSFIESAQKHIDSNLPQFFIGGANVKIIATKDKEWVLVEIENRTSRKSLMLHIGSNYERINGIKTPLSTIKQRLIFKMRIDTNKFYK